MFRRLFCLFFIIVFICPVFAEIERQEKTSDLIDIAEMYRNCGDFCTSAIYYSMALENTPYNFQAKIMKNHILAEIEQSKLRNCYLESK